MKKKNVCKMSGIMYRKFLISMEDLKILLMWMTMLCLVQCKLLNKYVRRTKMYQRVKKRRKIV
jgi:hypothetical protein